MVFKYPQYTGQGERFHDFPVKPAPVTDRLTIRWNQHAVPYIFANSEADVAFGLGLVHAHLRLGQIELLRVLSQGRVAETVGPLPYTGTLDDGVRILGLPKAAEKALSQLSSGQREWLQRYVDGMNWLIGSLKKKPFEHQFLNIPLKPFTVLDILTISKLVSSDLSWATYVRFLTLMKDGKEWQSRWKNFLDQGASSLSSVQNKHDEGLTRVIEQLTRSGSNSLVISSAKSTSGAALIANDPHVGLFLPNFWLIAGVHSPEQQAVGLMIPGLPFFGVGRNPQISWGGTNMRGLSSHLYDISNLEASAIDSTKETILRRNWFDRELSYRTTPFGPVFTDWSYFDGDGKVPDLALWWAGADGANEIAAFVEASKARDWTEFRNAFRDYRVSAMNILYADRQGNIGMLPAYGVPVLKNPKLTTNLIKSTDNPVVAILPVDQQPFEYNPPTGFIASANNKPFEFTPVPYSLAYAGSDRFLRLSNLAHKHDKWTVEGLKQLQQDTFLESAHALKSLIVKKVGEWDFGESNQDFLRFAAWNGSYDREDTSAPAFEVLMYFAWQDYVETEITDSHRKEDLRSTDQWRPILLSWVNDTSQADIRDRMLAWLKQGKKSLQRYQTWGSFHRQKLSHPFGGLPVIGRRFQKMEYGESGSNDTLFKAGRRFSADKSDITYGASARHISDLSDPNANYFVLKGGQDGWLDNPNLTDQVPLWDRGEYIQMPLDRSLIESQFARHVVVIDPDGSLSK
jgi:penicillin amidase